MDAKPPRATTNRRILDVAPPISNREEEGRDFLATTSGRARSPRAERANHPGSRAAELRRSEQTLIAASGEVVQSSAIARGASNNHRARRRRSGGSARPTKTAPPANSSSLRATTKSGTQHDPRERSEQITQCPRWDSNPCWSGFKPPASAIWATGARSATAGVILAAPSAQRDASTLGVAEAPPSFILVSGGNSLRSPVAMRSSITTFASGRKCTGCTAVIRPVALSRK